MNVLAPNLRTVFEALHDRERSAPDIADDLGISVRSVAARSKKLRELGLVTESRRRAQIGDKGYTLFISPDHWRDDDEARALAAAARSAPASRNLISDEQRAINAQRYTAWTFNAEVPDEYDGVLFMVACVKLGDHAHLDVHTGRQHPNPKGWDPTRHLSRAGKLILRWHEWEVFRDLIAELDVPIVLREVFKPSRRQLELHGS